MVRLLVIVDTISVNVTNTGVLGSAREEYLAGFHALDETKSFAAAPAMDQREDLVFVRPFRGVSDKRFFRGPRKDDKLGVTSLQSETLPLLWELNEVGLALKNEDGQHSLCFEGWMTDCDFRLKSSSHLETSLWN